MSDAGHGGHAESHGGHGGHGKESKGNVIGETLGAPVEVFEKTITRREFLFFLRDTMYKFFGGFVTAIFRRGGGHGGGGKSHGGHGGAGHGH